MCAVTRESGQFCFLAEPFRAKIFLEPRIAKIYTDKIQAREAQGYAWASQVGDMLSNPFASELARDSENHRSFCYANGPALSLRAEIVGRKCGVALGLQAGICCEKASASPLASVFSKTDPAFAQRINPVFSIFLSVYILVIRG
jgi:hypothetical protein